MAKNNIQSVSYLFCTQVIKPQIVQKPLNQPWKNLQQQQQQKTYTNIKHKIFEE